MVLKDLIESETIHSLYVWGVNGEHRAHSRFRRDTIREVLSLFEGRSPTSAVNYEHLRTASHSQSDLFPRNYEDAIRYVLEDELKEDTIHITKTDKLDERCRPPYRRYFSRKQGRVTGYVRQQGFQHFSAEEMDPLKRFELVIRTSQPEIWYHRWFLDHSVETLLGTVCEAIFACHAIYHEPCFHCKYRNCLRWLGGSKAAWQDLVCTVCNSIYELKTKADMDKIEQEFQRNSFNGGSFKEFYLLSNAISHQSRDAQSRNNKKKNIDQKMYLVVMPRTFSDKLGRKFYPVFCAEIKYVLPLIKSNYFKPRKPPNEVFSQGSNALERYMEPSIASSIKVNTVSKRLWFQLPRWEEPISWGDIMEDVYIRRFGKATFQRMEEIYYEKSDSGYYSSEDDADENITVDGVGDAGHANHQSPPSCPQRSVSAAPLADLTTELEGLKVGNDEEDDWDTMYDSDSMEDE